MLIERRHSCRRNVGSKCSKFADSAAMTSLSSSSSFAAVDAAFAAIEVEDDEVAGPPPA